MTVPGMAVVDAGSRPLMVAAAAGISVGLAYTLSPLAVWAAVGIWLLARVLVKGLDGDERRLVLGIFVIAVAIRVLLLAGLFASVDHGETPFGSLFGDEEYFKRRSLWLRSMALGVNISEADRTYALDEYSETSYLYFLAFLQMLVGDAPYGIHMFSMAIYAAASVWMFRFVRRAFGPAPATLTFAGILFLPTLFFWSVSALRESVHFFLTVAAVAGMIDVLTHREWPRKLAGVLLVAVVLYALRDLRQGSMAVVGASLLVGTAASIALVSWRRVAVAVALAIVVIAAGLTIGRAAVEDRVMNTVRSMAMSHQGHAFTRGVHYKVLEPKFYQERAANVMDDMTPIEAARYVIRALAAAVVVPLPWQADTGLLRAYLPEHMVWLGMCLLAPVGVWAAARRHPPAAFMMGAYVAIMFAGIALRSGNVGTLVRHRGLVLPFVICLAVVAACHLLSRRSQAAAERMAIRGAD